MCKMGRGLVTLKKKYKNGGKGVKNLQFGAKECFEYPCFSNKVASVVVTGYIVIYISRLLVKMNLWMDGQMLIQNVKMSYFRI